MLDSEAIGRVIAKGSQNASSVERNRKAGKDGTSDVWTRNGQPPATPVEAQIASARDAIGQVGEAEGALATAGAAIGALTAIEQAISAPLSAIPFPAFPAVRITDKAVGLPHAHMHPPNLIPPAPPIPLPSMGPVIKIPFLSGADTVLINGLPAARCGDLGLGIWCGGYFPLYEIFLGSSSVWIEGARAARLGVDITKHCVFTTPRPSDPPLGPMIGTTITGSPNVFIGGIPMPSLTNMAIGAAFKLAFKGVAKVVSAAKGFSRKAAAKASGQLPRKAAVRFPQTGSGNFIGSADEAYEAIRASTTDVAAIAKNTGFKPSNIQKIKDHLFYNEHLLDRYVAQGEPAVWGRFDSDLGQAQAWQRLELGTHTPADIQMLKHEIAEAWYMRNVTPSYDAAHNAAEARFPAPKW